MKSKLFLKHVLLSFAGFILLINIIFLWLRFYTLHGKSIATPDFYGMSEAEVVELCDKYNLRYEIADSIYLMEAKKGTVVSQNPHVGFKVKRNRNIFLIMNAMQPEKSKMPNVKGLSFRYAKAKLESAGFFIGKIKYRPDLAIDNVLEQSVMGKPVEMGDFFVKGTAVDLMLGNGYSTKSVSTPELLGNHLRDSKGDLTNAHLNIGAVVYDNSIVDYKDSINARVYKQKPVSGVSLFQGASVDVWLTVDSTKIVISDAKQKDE